MLPRRTAYDHYAIDTPQLLSYDHYTGSDFEIVSVVSLRRILGLA